MARIPGIQIEKDSKGRPTYARINLKKRKDALPYLKQVGAIEDKPVINPDDYITGKELVKQVHDEIEKWDWKPEQRKYFPKTKNPT